MAKAAKSQGYDVVAIGLKEETAASLEQEVGRMYWLTLDNVGDVPDLLKKEEIKEVILAGQIRPERLLQGDSKFDGVVQQLLKFVPDRSGASAMKIAVHYLESQGFKVLDSSVFLKEWIPQQGVLTKRPPTAEEQADVLYGIPLARDLNRLGIGQTLVIRRKSVVAVEAMEGTDAAVARAGQVAGAGCVVVKACGSQHDMRFDIPVLGIETVRAMSESGASCIGVEAKRTLLFEKPELVAEADQRGLAIVAV